MSSQAGLWLASCGWLADCLMADWWLDGWVGWVVQVKPNQVKQFFIHMENVCATHKSKVNGRSFTNSDKCTTDGQDRFKVYNSDAKRDQNCHVRFRWRVGPIFARCIL